MNKIFQNIASRFPSQEQMILAAGSIELFIFSWSLRGFFFRAPSYILYMNIGQILAVAAYYMAFALLESALVLIVFALAAAILPSNWLKQNFGVGSFPMILVIAVSSYYLQQQITYAYPGIKYIAIGYGSTLLGAAIMAAVFIFVPILRKWLGWLVEQVSIFAYLYTFIGVISLLTVIIRLVI